MNCHYQKMYRSSEPLRGQDAAAAIFRPADRVIVYHISDCGVCNDCRRGYMISCANEKCRRAYGWQRDGGMAGYMIAKEKDLIALPNELSFADGVPGRVRVGDRLRGPREGGRDISQVRDLTSGQGVERALECSSNSVARVAAVRATRNWGKIAFVGEGGAVEFKPSPDLIHDQKTSYGSRATSTWLMAG